MNKDYERERKLLFLNFYACLMQNSTLRWLLPRTLLHNGFYSKESISPNILECDNSAFCTSYSWSGNRKPPSFLKQFVFPEDMIAALRIVSMKEDELQAVISMLEEVLQSNMNSSPKLIIFSDALSDSNLFARFLSQQVCVLFV